MTSSSRVVSWAGLSRVLRCGPRGMPAIPLSRMRRATIAAAGRAPSPRIRCETGAARPRCRSARTTRPLRTYIPALPSEVRLPGAGPSSSRFHGSGALATCTASKPARCHQHANGPATQGASRSSASSSAASMAPAIPSRSPRSQAASAIAAATGAIRCNSLVGQASSRASSSSSCTWGSPLRARRSPSTTRA